MRTMSAPSQRICATAWLTWESDPARSSVSAWFTVGTALAGPALVRAAAMDTIATRTARLRIRERLKGVVEVTGYLGGSGTSGPPRPLSTAALPSNTRTRRHETCAVSALADA